VRPPSPLARIASVRVGSRNEPKLEAVRSALAAYASDPAVVGVEVESGVPEQPVGFPEIVAGARNRARGAFRSGACDLAVGIEDGLVEIDLGGAEREVLNVGCAVVVDGVRESLGLSSGFAYPPDCVRPALRDREPIGDVFDRVFRAWSGEGAGAESPAKSGGAAGELHAQPGAVPSGRGIGNIGKLSLGVLPRSDYARHAVLCALVRFLHPGLYDRESRA